MRTSLPLPASPSSASSTPGSGSIGGGIICRPADRISPVAEIKRSFQHRQRKALGAIAIGGKVAPLDRCQLCLDGLGFREIAEQFVESRMRHAENRLFFPERVVGIEAHDRDGHATTPWN